MKGTTNAQRNAVVDSSYANNQLKLTYADGSVDTHTLASPIVIDDALSSTSTNPVQNKVVKGALDGKLGKTETAAKATADADGNTISTTYLKSATASTTYLKQTDASGTYLKKTDAASTYATQDALASAIGSVYRYKNSVTNYSDLPSSGNTVGDVYNVVNAYGNVPAGTNWAWNGSAWDALAGTVDLSPYAKATDVANTYATQTALNNGLAGKQNTLVVGTNLDSAPTSGSTNPVTSGGVYSAINEINVRTPTSDGADGQVWTSDGAGAGKWANDSGSKKLKTSGDLDDLITNDGTNITVLQDFDVEFIFKNSTQNYHISEIRTVKAGTYKTSNIKFATTYMDYADATKEYVRAYVWCNSNGVGTIIYNGDASIIYDNSSISSKGDVRQYKLYV